MSKHDLQILKKGLQGRILKVEDPRDYDALDILKSYFREILVLARKYTRPTVEYEDLVVEGIIGLLDAIGRWDPEKSGGPRSFHQLAIVRIKSQMFEYSLANDTKYSIPNHMARAMALINQIRNCINSYEYQGDSEEVLRNLEAPHFDENVPKEISAKVRSLKERIQSLGKSPERSYEEVIEHVLKIEQNLESYEGDVEYEVSPEEIAAQREFLDKFLGGLNKDARDVVGLLLQGYTLDQVGQEKGFTRERARQIKEQTLQFFERTRMYRDTRDSG